MYKILYVLIAIILILSACEVTESQSSHMIINELENYSYNTGSLPVETNNFFNSVSDKLLNYFNNAYSINDLKESKKTTNGFFININNLIDNKDLLSRIIIFGNDNPIDGAFDVAFIQTFDKDDGQCIASIVEKNIYTASTTGEISEYKVYQNNGQEYLMIINKKHNYEGGIDFYKIIVLKRDNISWHNILKDDQKEQFNNWSLTNKADDGTYVYFLETAGFTNSTYEIDNGIIKFTFFNSKKNEQIIELFSNDKWGFKQ